MITLYGGPTTNVRKVTIALEELSLNYTAKHVRLDLGQQRQDWFTEMVPNQKIPLLEDHDRSMQIWESGAILTYLAEQYDAHGKILARTGNQRYAAIQGAFFQAAHIGPNLGRLNDQLRASDETKIPKMIDLFFAEAERLSEVLDRMLADNRSFLAGEYSIADIMHYPWLAAARELQFPALMQKNGLLAWLDRIAERPAVQKGMASFS